MKPGIFNESDSAFMTTGDKIEEIWRWQREKKRNSEKIAEVFSVLGTMVVIGVMLVGLVAITSLIVGW